MGGLTEVERERLRSVVALRLGPRSDADVLVRCYLDAMERNAFARTVENGPVPTSLTVERSLILIEVSRQLGRVVEDFEIAALFRVPPTSARAMQRMLRATYSDDADELDVQWSLRDARVEERNKVDGLLGTVLSFSSEERRDAFYAYALRSGYTANLILGDQQKPWKAIVGDEFPKDRLPKAKR